MWQFQLQEQHAGFEMKHLRRAVVQASTYKQFAMGLCLGCPGLHLCGSLSCKEQHAGFEMKHLRRAVVQASTHSCGEATSTLSWTLEMV